MDEVTLLWAFWLDEAATVCTAVVERKAAADAEKQAGVDKWTALAKR